MNVTMGISHQIIDKFVIKSLLNEIMLCQMKEILYSLYTVYNNIFIKTNQQLVKQITGNTSKQTGEKERFKLSVLWHHTYLLKARKEDEKIRLANQ